MTQALTKDGLARLDRVLAGYVERGDIPGLAWLVARGGEAHVGVAGSDGPGARRSHPTRSSASRR